ncbi:MAG: DUF559 domain-containing protein [Phycisphaerales bacterium]
MPHRDLNTSRARELRRDTTPPERVLWSMLRNRGLAGLKFRRQQSIGPYVADFYCPEARLVVEIDSQVHDRAHDDRRDASMRAEGIETIRITAGDCASSLDGVLVQIRRVAEARIEDLRKAEKG